MKRLTPWLLAVLAFAGCAKNTTRPTAKMREPTGVALFRGFGTDPSGALHHLLAVSNTGGDDLRIIDAVTDKVLEGPTAVAALTIPTEPRPSLIAAGRLDDLDPVAAVAGNTIVADRPDLLVVAPRGLVNRPLHAGQFAAAIQVVVTWETAMRAELPIDLGDYAPDATITSLAVIPVAKPDGLGGWMRDFGKARVVIGLSDGGLLTMEASRVANKEAIQLALPVRQDLGFTPLDLAPSQFNPAQSNDGLKLYVATTDPIPGPGGVLGVAELDMTGTPGAFPVRALSARVGTTRVAAVRVAPFVANRDPLVDSVPDYDVFGAEAPRVFAAIDQSACGRDRSMPCGVAVLDPVAGGLAPDPAGEMPYQLPFQLDGEVVDLAVSGPPLYDADSSRPGFLQLAPGSGKRWTQSIAAFSSSVGQLYLADLSHFTLANDVSALVGGSRTRLTAAASIVPSLTSNTIGVWLWLIPVPTPKDPTPKWPLYIHTDAVYGIGVTPGYTPSESWYVTYQGVLPGLGNRVGVARVPAVGQPPAQVALQQATGLTSPGSERWRSVVRVYDPRLAVQPYDIVEVEAPDVYDLAGNKSNPCPLGKFEMVVTGLVSPSADSPGGALALALPTAKQPTNTGQTLPADPTCLKGLETEVNVSVRAWGYVLNGSHTGYAGRPQENFDPADPTTPPFELKYENEDLLSCPIMPDRPEAWPPAAADVAACEANVATCRATCERLVLARRARRIFYVSNRCADKYEQTCFNTWVQLPDTVNGDPQPFRLPRSLAFPLPKGPVVSFKLAVKRDAGGYDPPERGALLSFSTGSGYSPAVRVPYSTTGTVSGAVLPGRVVLHDRTEATKVATDGIHGFAAFTDNLVLEFAAGAAGQNATTIR